MGMKDYIVPDMEITEFETEDVIAISGNPYETEDVAMAYPEYNS